MGLAVAVSVAARLVLLLRRPLWEDETFTIWAARKPPGELLGVLRRDSGPPLFYLLDRVFVALGEAARSDALARLLPLLAVLALFGGALWLPPGGARRRFLLLAATSPLLLLYAAEARAYGLLAALAFALFLLTLPAAIGTGRAGAIALVGAAALYTHYLAVFVVASLGLVCLFSGRRPAAIALLASVALFLPWLPILLAQPAGALAWSREHSGSTAVGFFASLGGAGRIPAPFGPPLPQALFGAGALLGLLLAALLLAGRGDDEPSRRGVAFAFLVLGAILLASLWRPLAFAGRSELAVLPVWLWTMAAAGERRRSIRVASWAVAFLGAAASLWVLRSPDVPSGAARAARTVARAAGPDDAVFAGAGFYLPVRLAADRGELRARLHAFPAEIALHPGWFVPAPPGREDYGAVLRAAEETTGKIFLLLPDSYRTPFLVFLLRSRGRLREAARGPEGVVLVWERTVRR